MHLRGAHGHWFLAPLTTYYNDRARPYERGGVTLQFPLLSGLCEPRGAASRASARTSATRSSRRQDRSPLASAGPPVTPLPPSWWGRSSPRTSELQRAGHSPHVRCLQGARCSANVVSSSRRLSGVVIPDRGVQRRTQARGGRGAFAGRAQSRESDPGRAHRSCSRWLSSPVPSLRPTLRECGWSGLAALLVSVLAGERAVAPGRHRLLLGPAPSDPASLPLLWLLTWLRTPGDHLVPTQVVDKEREARKRHGQGRPVRR